MRKKILAASTILLLIYGCTEIYEPEISSDDVYIVVEGLITDEPGPHVVKLTRTNVFGEDIRANYLSNASIKIVDSENNVVNLQERMAGNYYTPDNFSGQIGETYTLHITTSDGQVFKSDPQKMVSPVSVDNVYGESSQQTFVFESQVAGELYQREVEGVNLFFDVSRDDDQYPKFRFTSTLMLQYEWEVGGNGMASVYDFCWVKRHIIEFLEGDIPENLNKPEMKRNRVAFVPFYGRNMRYLGFPIYGRDQETHISYIHPRIVIKRVYSLNDDAYDFHYDRNKQLGGEGSFFDPISPQLLGNIHNVDDKDDIILGFFEASSVQKTTLNIRIMSDQHIIEIDTIDCLEHVSNSGCLFNEHPDWWL